MVTYHIQGLTWIDTDMEDGYVLVWDEEWPTFFMTKPTYLALSSYGDARQRLPAALWDLRVPSSSRAL